MVASVPFASYLLLLTHQLCTGKLLRRQESLSMHNDTATSARFLILTNQYPGGHGFKAAYDSKVCYAQQHGYEIQAPSDNYASAMSLSPCQSGYWVKFAAVAKAFAESQAEWIVWMDSDVVVLDKRVTLESYVDDSHDLAVADAGCFNCGVFMIRRSQWGKAFMEKWRSESASSNCYGHDNLGFDAAVFKAMARDLGKPEPACTGAYGTCYCPQVRSVRESWDPTMKPGWHQGPSVPKSTTHVLAYNARTFPGGLNSGCGWGVNAYQPGNPWVHFAGKPNRNDVLARVASVASACIEGQARDLSISCICSGQCS